MVVAVEYILLKAIRTNIRGSTIAPEIYKTSRRITSIQIVVMAAVKTSIVATTLLAVLYIAARILNA